MTERYKGSRTKAAPITEAGVTFHSYRVGILRYELRSEDGRLKVRRNANSTTYSATVDGKPIETASRRPTRFRTARAAMRAAIQFAAVEKTK